MNTNNLSAAKPQRSASCPNSQRIQTFHALRIGTIRAPKATSHFTKVEGAAFSANQNRKIKNQK